jgi:hypothetical protein
MIPRSRAPEDGIELSCLSSQSGFLGSISDAMTRETITCSVERTEIRGAVRAHATANTAHKKGSGNRIRYTENE